MKKIWVVVISVVVTAIIVGGGVYWYEKNKSDKDKATLNTQISDLNARIATLASQTADAVTAKTAADAQAAADAAAATAAANAWKNYTNADYGFHLTFTDGWTGYKVKKVALEGLVAAYYVNIPTSDPLYATATDSTYAGYAAPFCIGVMNKSEWTGDEMQVRDFGDKVGENATYVFTSSRWQATPTDVKASITSTLAAVMSSFAL